MMVRVSRFSPADSIAEAAFQGRLPIWKSVKFYGWRGMVAAGDGIPDHSALCHQESWPVSRCMGYLKRGLDSAAVSFSWKPTSSEGNGGGKLISCLEECRMNWGLIEKQPAPATGWLFGTVVCSCFFCFSLLVSALFYPTELSSFLYFQSLVTLSWQR